MRLPILSSLQLIACGLVAAAGLVPVAQRTKPFWGLYGTSFDHGPPHIHDVDADSPAYSSGFRVGDVVLAVNGSAVDLAGMNAVLDGLKPGQTAAFRVKRGEAEVTMTAQAVDPPIAMIYYQTPWYPLAGGLGLALGLLIFATHPLRPAPRWRAILVTVVGFGLAVIFFLALADDNPFAYWQLRRYHTLNWGPKLGFGQSWVGLAASLALAALGAWELRGLLWRRTAPEVKSVANESPQLTAAVTDALTAFKPADGPGR